MYYIKATVKGIVPVCFNRPSDALQQQIETGQTGGPRDRDKDMAEAEARVYRDEHGLYFPSSWFKAAMLTGSSKANLKRGRLAFSTYLKGGVFFVDRNICLGKQQREFMHERWGRIPPGPKGKMAWLRNPGLKEGWEVTFRMLVAEDGLPEAHIKTSLATAGISVGVGNGRPDFGRFIITDWKRYSEEPSQ